MKFSKKIIPLISTLLCFILVMVCAGVTIWSSKSGTITNQQSVDGVDSTLFSTDNFSVGNTSLTDLNFTLINNGQEYSVGASNRQTITEVVVPSQYNGLPVTELATNAFMNCSLLTRVFIPSSIVKIGNSAFMMSNKLKRVVGMTGVTSIGHNAFSMCSSLENLMLPEGLITLGNSVIKNITNPVYVRATTEKMSTLNPNWNYNGNIVFGNTIVYENYTSADGVAGYQIAPWQNLAPSEEPLKIYSWCYENDADTIGAPLLNIGQGAFAHYETPSISIMHSEGSNLNHLINIEAYAFSYVNATNININTNISLVDPDFSTSDSLFAGSAIQSVILPDDIEELPKYMFAECVNLTEIKSTNTNIVTNHLSNKIISIGEGAFDQCYSMQDIYIHGNIEYIGDNTFSRWGTNPDVLMPVQNVFIDTVSESSNWGQLWNAGYDKEGCNIEFTGATEYSINFIVNQSGVVSPLGNDNLIVSPKSTLNDIVDITNPTSDSHNYSGVWYTTAERTHGTEFAFDREINKNLELYAGWDIKQFDRIFSNNKYLNFYNAKNGELLTGKTLTLEYNTSFQFYVAMNDGYNAPLLSHYGLALIPNTGGIYTIKITNESIINISAKLIDYTITYANLKSGKNPSSNPIAYTIESSAITFASPEWKAYNGRAWDFPIIPQGSYGNMTISAIWTNPVAYSIIYTNLRGGTNILNPTSYTIETPTINFAAPQWDAYEGANWDISSIQQGSSGVKNLKAIWSNPKEFKINYTNLRGGVNPSVNPLKYTIESPSIEFMLPTWNAYQNSSWSVNNISSGSIGDRTIKAGWHNPVKFNINYELHGNAKNHWSNPSYYTIESPEIILERPDGRPKPGYYYIWTNRTIKAGSTGHITKTVSYNYIPIRYRVSFLTTNVDSPNNTMEPNILNMGGFFVSYDESFVINKVFGKGSDYFICYTIESGPPDVVYEVTNDSSVTLKNLTDFPHGDTIDIYTIQKACVAEESMITLADGTQKAVEELTGAEQLLVWNLKTGTFDTAPILFIDSDPSTEYEIINLHFSDGTVVKAIYEHAFWNSSLNKYVFLRDDGAKYIGDMFNKQTYDSEGNMVWTSVELVDVVITNEVTTAWSPVTYNHLCYYVNGMLSMPGGTTGLINIFDVDAETMTIDIDSYNADLAEYGLYTYEEFLDIYYVPEVIFKAFNIQYFKVAIGKGILTMDMVEDLIATYSEFWS